MFSTGRISYSYESSSIVWQFLKTVPLCYEKRGKSTFSSGFYFFRIVFKDFSNKSLAFLIYNDFLLYNLHIPIYTMPEDNFYILFYTFLIKLKKQCADKLAPDFRELLAKKLRKPCYPK